MGSFNGECVRSLPLLDLVHIKKRRGFHIGSKMINDETEIEMRENLQFRIIISLF